MQPDQTHSQGHTTTQAKTILIVEDDEAIGEFLVAVITEETPYHAYIVTNAYQALQTCTAQAIDLIILDYNLPLMNGLEFYDRLHALQGDHMPSVVMVSAYLPPTKELVQRNIPGLGKPLELQHLLDTIEHTLQ